MTAQHALQVQLDRCKFVFAFNFGELYPGWWRLSWPDGLARHERYLSPREIREVREGRTTNERPAHHHHSLRRLR